MNHSSSSTLWSDGRKRSNRNDGENTLAMAALSFGFAALRTRLPAALGVGGLFKRRVAAVDQHVLAADEI